MTTEQGTQNAKPSPSTFYRKVDNKHVDENKVGNPLVVNRDVLKCTFDGKLASGWMDGLL